MTLGEALRQGISSPPVRLQHMRPRQRDMDCLACCEAPRSSTGSHFCVRHAMNSRQGRLKGEIDAEVARYKVLLTPC